MEQEKKKFTIKHLLRVERIQMIYEDAKAIVISFGAKPETFENTDKRLKEIKDMIKKDVSGGIVLKPNIKDK